MGFSFVFVQAVSKNRAIFGLSCEEDGTEQNQDCALRVGAWKLLLKVAVQFDWFGCVTLGIRVDE